MRKTAAVYTDRRFQTSDAKTAHGLVRGPSRFDVVALLDASGAGCDAGELLDGQRRGIPTFADLDAMLGALPQRPDCFVIGVATSGGVLPPEMRPPILAAIQAGMDVVNGLHEFLADDPAIVAAAARAGVPFDPQRSSLRIGGAEVYHAGVPCPQNENAAHEHMLKDHEVVIELDLAAGDASAECWTCDYSADYVRINADYRS